MDNPKLKSGELSKIEFLVLTTDKVKFRAFCQAKNLGMAEVMKRKFEEALREMEGAKNV